MHNPIVVALDVDTPAEALALVERLRGAVGMFKVGKQLFTAAGPEIVRRIRDAGEQVFNVHAMGGTKMMQSVVQGVNEMAERETMPRPLILGVTVLTSHTQDSLTEVGVVGRLEDEVVRLARLCAASGLDGVVASPREIAPIRQAVEDSGFVILTPGVRPAGAALDDQRRVMTPGEAIRAGANYLVIGRPILEAADPGQAARAILEEIEQARN
jgi:orotidine-5'-phosphate decarboxylase